MTSPPTIQTLGAYASRFVEDRRRRGEITKDTARNHRSHLEGLVVSFGARPLTQMGPAAIERWQETIGHLSPATRRGNLSTVKVFSRWLVAQHLIRHDPTANLPPIRQPRSVPRALDSLSVATLLAAVPDERGRVIVWLMVGLGLRCCEVANLEVTDYDPGPKTIVVRGKGGHQRMLPVPPEPAQILDKYLRTVGVVSGPLLRSARRPGRRAGGRHHLRVGVEMDVRRRDQASSPGRGLSSRS